MRYLLSALLLAALIAPSGCSDATGDAPAPGLAQLRQALPDAEGMTIQLPQSTALVTEQATYYAFTRGVTLSVNDLVRDITNVIEDIVELPPTDTDDATYAIWGPWTEPLSPATYRVTVRSAEGGGFDYLVEGWPKGESESEAVTVLSGHHLPGEGAHRGEGGWTYDLTAAHDLDPIAQDSIGTIAITYNFGDARNLEVTFSDVQGPDQPEVTSALYRYTDAADGSGTFDFTSNLDIHEGDGSGLDRRELLQVRSRWLASGPGRSDVLATHGDLPAGVEVDATECWDAAFVRTWLWYAWPNTDHSEGDAAACPYADRELPQFEGFDADAFADGELIVALPGQEDLDIEPAPVSEEATETATYYQLAKRTVEGLQQQVGDVLETVHNITRFPATGCDEGGCHWGPWTDWDAQLTTALFVSAGEDGSYSYRLMVQRFGDADDSWETLVQGGFLDDGEGDGHGWFAWDLEVHSRYSDDIANVGLYRAEYAHEGADAALHVRLEQVRLTEGGEPTDSEYYIAASGGAGYLDLAFPYDTDEGADGRTAVEDFEGRIRWIGTGAGVADIRVSGGDVGESQEYLGVECWDDHAAQTHTAVILRDIDASDTPALDGPGCVFDDWQPASFPAMESAAGGADQG